MATPARHFCLEQDKRDTAGHAAAGDVAIDGALPDEGVAGPVARLMLNSKSAGDGRRARERAAFDRDGDG